MAQQTNKKPKRAARRGGQGPVSLTRYIRDHRRVFLQTLEKLGSRPAATLLTAAVIGVTLALPASFYLLLKNADRLSYSWERSTQASLFLKQEVSEKAGRSLARQLAAEEDISGTEYISQAQALADFRRASGFGKALELLDDNPLPAVISLQPKPGLSAAATQSLIEKLSKLPEVEQAQVDQAWLSRLQAILALAERLMMVIAILLGLAVIFIVGNTIRLDIQNRKEEIEVMKLLGATDSFVGRPFLYTGLCYGLAGSVVAWFLLWVLLWLLAGPVRQLAGLYASQFSLAGPDLKASLLLLAAGPALGWLGSWWTVRLRLTAIEPR